MEPILKQWHIYRLAQSVALSDTLSEIDTASDNVVRVVSFGKKKLTMICHRHDEKGDRHFNLLIQS